MRVYKIDFLFKIVCYNMLLCMMCLCASEEYLHVILLYLGYISLLNNGTVDGSLYVLST